MKRILSLLIALGFVFMFGMNALAEDGSRKYFFDLEANGRTEIEADPGDIINLTLHLKRVDSDEKAPVYAMQDEIYYDENFFDIVSGSSMAGLGINTNDIYAGNGYSAHYMNFVSFSGGEEWDSDTYIGTFQLLVTGTHGSSAIENKNFIVSTADGMDTYLVESEDVIVIVTRECTIHFETNGGSIVDDQEIELYGKIKEPKTKKEGYHVEGWYLDKDLTEKWDFKKDTVKGNMTLYAKWEEGSEESNVWIIIPILVIAAGGLLYFYKKRKKDGNDDVKNTLPLSENIKEKIRKIAKAEADLIDSIIYKNKAEKNYSNTKNMQIPKKEIIVKSYSEENGNVVSKTEKSEKHLQSDNRNTKNISKVNDIKTKEDETKKKVKIKRRRK